jgi:hypothetical protein
MLFISYYEGNADVQKNYWKNDVYHSCQLRNIEIWFELVLVRIVAMPCPDYRLELAVIRDINKYYRAIVALYLRRSIVLYDWVKCIEPLRKIVTASLILNGYKKPKQLLVVLGLILLLSPLMMQ